MGNDYASITQVDDVRQQHHRELSSYQWAATFIKRAPESIHMSRYTGKGAVTLCDIQLGPYTYMGAYNDEEITCTKCLARAKRFNIEPPQGGSRKRPKGQPFHRRPTPHEHNADFIPAPATEADVTAEPHRVVEEVHTVAERSVTVAQRQQAVVTRNGIPFLRERAAGLLLDATSVDDLLEAEQYLQLEIKRVQREGM